MALQMQIARVEWLSNGEVTNVLDVAPDGEIIEYIPAAPPTTIRRTKGRQDGEWPAAHEVGNVVESVQLSLVRESDVWAAFHDIDAALQRAMLWAEDNRRDMRTVIRFRDTARHSDWYEAPLVGGEVKLGKGPIVTMAIERGPYWSGPESRLQVQNNGTSGWADYATVTNCDDDHPDHDNWVFVAAPAGTVEALARIRLENTTNAAARLHKVWIGWRDRPQALTLEGEDSEYPKTLATGTEWSNAARAEAAKFKWTLPQSTVVDYSGVFRVMANGALAGETWRVSAGYELSRRQYGTRAAAVGVNGWTDLGELSLPPGYTHPTRYPISIWLDGSGAGKLDYMVFMPVMCGQHRTLVFDGYNCVYGGCLEDDVWREEVAYEYGGQRLPVVDAYGDAIRLWPEALLPFVIWPPVTPLRQQMLVFAMENDVGGAEAMRSAKVEVFARPRWRTLP